MSMILTYESVKEKTGTLRAMTSLNRDEFELLCLSFRRVWEEETQQSKRDVSQGGRKPILKKHEDRLLFILFYLKTYPLQEVLAHLFGMSQGLANFLIDQLGHILRETLKRMDHLPGRISEEMLRKLAEEEPQDLAIDGRWCINKLRGISPLLSVYSGQSNPYRDGNGHTEVGHDIQRGDSDLRLRDLSFEKTGRQAITEQLLEAIHGIFGEATAMIADRLFPGRQPLCGDDR